LSRVVGSLQWRNLSNDASYAKLKSDLIANFYDSLQPERDPRLAVESPV